MLISKLNSIESFCWLLKMVKEFNELNTIFYLDPYGYKLY